MLSLIISSSAGLWVTIMKSMVFLSSQLRNHSGVINYPNELDIYLEAELVRYSIAGPFLSPPFSGRITISPLNSVSKKDLTEQCIILDLSWPLNTSVNTGIDKLLHEGVESHSRSHRAIFKTRNGESGNGNGERGTGNGESLKRGIFKSGNL